MFMPCTLPISLLNNQSDFSCRLAVFTQWPIPHAGIWKVTERVCEIHIKSVLGSWRTSHNKPIWRQLTRASCIFLICSIKVKAHTISHVATGDAHYFETLMHRTCYNTTTCCSRPLPTLSVTKMVSQTQLLTKDDFESFSGSGVIRRELQVGGTWGYFIDWNRWFGADFRHQRTRVGAARADAQLVTAGL